MKEFKIFVDGEEKVAELVTRLYVKDLGVSYIYYYIKEENDNDNTEKMLLSSRVQQDENGYDDIIPITTDVEKNLAFKIYSDTYKKIQ